MMRRGFFLALVIWPTFASANCIDIEKVRAFAREHHATWREMKRDEWEFLRGVYVLNPQTPPGLPPGDRAVLSISGEDGMIFFVDGKMVCNSMPAPHQLREMLDALGTPQHEGKGL